MNRADPDVARPGVGRSAAASKTHWTARIATPTHPSIHGATTNILMTTSHRVTFGRFFGRSGKGVREERRRDMGGEEEDGKKEAEEVDMGSRSFVYEQDAKTQDSWEM